jgi:hypothetical protein
VLSGVLADERVEGLRAFLRLADRHEGVGAECGSLVAGERLDLFAYLVAVGEWKAA